MGSSPLGRSLAICKLLSIEIDCKQRLREGPAIVETHRSGCPIATSLDFVGDRWSLIIVRDMLIGKQRYGQFLDSPEGIPTNILANRLKRLEADGIISRTAYQDHPRRFAYSPTELGESLLPVLQAMCRWANVHFPETRTPPASFMKPRPRRKGR